MQDVVMHLLENVGSSISHLHSGKGVMKVAKFTDADNIGVYLTTFERQIATYDIDETC